MTEASPELDEDRLRRLVRELETVVRRELPWPEGNQQDPGITLLELFAFVGDTLSEYQNRAADEGYLQSRRTWGLILHNVLGTSPLTVTVNGSPWHEVVSLETCGPADAVYVADRDANGSATILFGDGQHGRRPPAGAQVVATYRQGGGGAGLVATLAWPPEPPLSLEVHAGSAHISFAPARRTWRDYLARWLAARR
jgi:hypothetical protein